MSNIIPRNLQRFINLFFYSANHYPILFSLTFITLFIVFIFTLRYLVNKLFRLNSKEIESVGSSEPVVKNDDNKGLNENNHSSGSKNLEDLEPPTEKNNDERADLGNINTDKPAEMLEPTTKLLEPPKPPKPPVKPEKEDTVQNNDKKTKTIDRPVLENLQLKEPEVVIIDPKPETNQKKPKIIGYTPNNQFLQREPYQYGVVKMPKPKSYVKFARNGRSNKRGFTEAAFLVYLKSTFNKEFKIFDDKHIPTISNRPYEPDFILINENDNKNIYIIIEIDEPYDGYQRTPTHCLAEDDYRDEFLTARGWIVIKFAEIQIHKEPLNCCALISKVISSIDSSFQNTLSLKTLPTIVDQWDSLTAKKWALNNYREKYLGITSFGKVPEVVIDYQIVESESDKIVEEAIPKSKTKLTKQTGSLVSKHKISRDSRIHFDSINHRYYIDKDPLTLSVTQLIDKFFPEFDSPYWAHIKANQRGITTEAILAEWKENGVASANQGTSLHEAIENYYNDKPHNTETVEFNYFLDFKNKYPSFTPFRTEWRVFDEDVMVAGTIDMVYKKENGDLFIFDWKRSKKVLTSDGVGIDTNSFHYAFGGLSHIGDNSFNRYCLQQNIYKYILESKYGQKISSMNLLILHENYDSAKHVKIPEMKKEVEYIFNYARMMK